MSLKAKIMVVEDNIDEAKLIKMTLEPEGYEVVTALNGKEAKEKMKKENPDFIKTGDAAIVKIVPTRPMVIEPSKKIPQLGRFAIRDMGQTVAAGVCLDVEEAK